MYRGETLALECHAQAWARQVEVQAQAIVVSGCHHAPNHDSEGDLIDGYARQCNMGGRTNRQPLP